jgi:hypothetical protein
VEEPEVETDDPLDISAGRGSTMGVNRYAVPSDIVKHLSEKNIQTFRLLSESWHRFLGLESRSGGADVEGENANADADTDEHKSDVVAANELYRLLEVGSASGVNGKKN